MDTVPKDIAKTSSTSLRCVGQWPVVEIFSRKLEALRQIYEDHKLSQLFVKRDDNGLIFLTIAKSVDDYLVIGHRSESVFFRHSISRRFTIGRFVLGNEFLFNRLSTSRGRNGSIQIDKQEYFSAILPIEMTELRKEKQRDQCTAEEVRSYQPLSGALNFLGNGALPQVSFVASYFQQQIPNLQVAQLVTANKILKKLKTLASIIRYFSASFKFNSSSL